MRSTQPHALIALWSSSLIVAALLAWHFVGRDRIAIPESSAATATTTRTSATDVAASPSAATTDLAPRGAPVRREAEPVATPQRRFPDAPVTPVEGTIEWETEDRRVPATQSGGFFADLIDGPDDDPPLGPPAQVAADDPRRVQVVDGRFRFDARGATAFKVVALTLDDAPAEVAKLARIDDDGSVTIVAWRGEPEAVDVIDVVDAATGAALDEVTLLEPWDALSAMPEHPGRTDRGTPRAEHQRSPVSIRVKERRITRLWVGAADHAWTVLTLEGRVGTTRRRVELAPEAALEVVVDGTAIAAVVHVDDRPRLRVRRDDGAVVLDLLATDESFHFDGLAPGHRTVSIEIGEPDEEPLVIARSEVELAPGATRKVALVLADDAVPRPAPVKGRVFASSQWQEFSFRVDLEPVGGAGRVLAGRRRLLTTRLAPVDATSGWRNFAFDAVLPGRYVLRVTEAGIELDVTVPRGGRDDVVVTLPEPTTVSVTTVDATTNAPVAVTQLWMFTGSVDHYGRPLHARSIEEVAAGRSTLLAAPGSVYFTIDSSSGFELDEADATHELHAGRNEITLRLHPCCTIDVRFDPPLPDDGAPQSASLTWNRMVDAGDGSEAAAGTFEIDLDRAGASVVLPRSGRYRIEIVGRDHRAVVESFEVDAIPGQKVTVTAPRVR